MREYMIYLNNSIWDFTMISRIDGFSSSFYGATLPNNNNKLTKITFISEPKKVHSDVPVSFLPSEDWKKTSVFYKRLNKAIKLQTELKNLYYKDSLNKESIQNSLNKYSPVAIEVKPIEELPKAVERNARSVVMIPKYKDSFNLTGATLYVDDKFDKMSEASKLITDCIFEYSNILQRSDDRDYFSLRKFTSNHREAKFLGLVSKYGAQDFEKNLLGMLEQNPKYSGARRFEDMQAENIVKLLPPKKEISKMLSESLDKSFSIVFDRYKIPEKYSGEYNFFYNKAKPYLKDAVIRQFEMKSEALSTKMETHENDLLPNLNELLPEIKNKNTCDAIAMSLK